METFYNSTVTKYYWPEFKEKVLVKDKGEELKRRMIIYNTRSMGITTHNDLYEICQVHGKILLDKFSG